MSYKLRDQMSEALVASNSESFLQLKIICQPKNPPNNGKHSDVAPVAL